MAQAKTMSSKGSGFKFKWWMAVLVVGVIVAIGVLVRVLSHAGGSGGPYNKYRAYVQSSDNQYLTIIQFKQYDYASIFAPAASLYVEENWINFGKYPNAVSTIKANTVPRWVRANTLDAKGNITPNSQCAYLQKVIGAKSAATLTSITAMPPLYKGDNIDLYPTSDCNTIAQG